jgi:hypothetical protein
MSEHITVGFVNGGARQYANDQSGNWIRELGPYGLDLAIRASHPTIAACYVLVCVAQSGLFDQARKSSLRDLARRINGGYCGDFAANAFSLLTDSLQEEAVLIQANHLPRNKDGGDTGHVWLRSGGKHFDAECPQGVDQPSDLEFFKRALERYGHDHQGELLRKLAPFA